MNDITPQKNTVYISHTIHTDAQISKAFQFITSEMNTYYPQLAQGHEYFRITNGDTLQMGSIIECAESAGNQTITHMYSVNEIIPGERIQYSSTPSHVKIRLPWKTIESTSNTYVYYDFDHNEGKTAVRLTIGIQFSNAFERIFSQLTGGLAPWKKHCKEEMEGLKKLLDHKAQQSG